MQKSTPSRKMVLIGQVDEKARGIDDIPVSMDEEPTDVPEMAQRSRRREGNPDLNSDLEIKADELEKLFAEHMLRSASAPRRRSVVRSSSAGTVTPAEPAEFDGDVLAKLANKEDSSMNSRGKYYERYMQIRDAKLGQERRSRGAVKEAHLKAMQEQLEQCWGLTKARSSVSSSNSHDGDRQYAEELKQLAACAIEQKEQQTLEVWKSEAGDGTEDFNKEPESDQDRSVNGMLGNSNRSQRLKNIFPSSRNATSSVSQTSATSLPRSTIKPDNFSRRQGRKDSEHLLSQSLPSMSDLKKENGGRISRIKPVKKSSNNHNRSASAKDDRTGRSRSIGESSNLVGSNGVVSTVNSNDSAARPLFEDTSNGRLVQKSVESKPFLRKGKGIGPGAGAVVAKRQALLALENLKIKDEPDGSRLETEGSFDEINQGGDEFNMGLAEAASMAEDESKMASDKEASVDKYESKMGSVYEASTADYENHRPSTGSGGNADSESSDALELNPPMQISSPSAIITSKGSSSSTTMPGSLVEIPMACKSNVQHNFACAQQVSDFDSFVDSPIGGSASENLHHIDQVTKSDAAFMSTESGIAHNHVLAGRNPRQTKINVAKGFKRLLRLGKIYKRNDPLVNDWVSPSTNSGGDDNMDDNCNQGSQMLADVKKSRIWLSQNHHASDDTALGGISNVQGEAFNCSTPVPPDDVKLSEHHPSGVHPKTPRSFFSLSTFRVRRSHPKLR